MADVVCVTEPILSSLNGQLMEVYLSDFIAKRLEAKTLDGMNIFSPTLEGCILKYLSFSNDGLGEEIGEY